jgi:drug/metabolite transporter (DMT)-like permease
MGISDLGELVLLAVVWGGSFLLMRIAAPELGPIWLIEIRVLLAGLALLALLIRLNLSGELRKYLVPLSILGCINSAIPFVLFAFAALYLPAGFAAILNAVAPLFGLIIAWLWLQEHFTLSRTVGFALGFAGVIVLVGLTSLPITPSFVLSVGAGLLASLMYAFAATYIQQNLSGVPPLVIATGSQLSAAVILLPFVPFTMPTALPSIQVMLVVVALALFSTALAYILYFRLIKNIGVTKALTVTYLIPLFAMIWGKIILQEAITQSMLLGCGLILLGTAIANELFKPKNV